MINALPILCFFIGAALSAASNSNPIMTIAPNITLQPLTPKEFPDLAVSLPPEMDRYRHAYFVLVNDSDREITALTAVWSYTSIETGKPKLGVISTVDSYLLSADDFRAVVKPHSRYLVDPGKSAASYFDDAEESRIGLSVDSIIFSDGEVIGANQFRVDLDIAARNGTARQLSSRVRMDRMHGKTFRDSAIDFRSGTETGAAAQWRTRHSYALENLPADKPGLVDAFLDQLQHMAPVPVFKIKEKN